MTKSTRSFTQHWATSPREERQERKNALREVTREGSVVYAIRRGDGIVKIGYTSDLPTRMRQLGGELLAFKYGGYAEEKALHERLAGHRAHGREYYYPTPVVLEAVNELRSDLGLPRIAS